MNILVVDDDAAVAGTVVQILSRSKHNVDVEYDGFAALTKLIERPSHYHILITDSSMPGLSGMELLGRLRETEFNGKVILLSGYVTEEMQKACRLLDVAKIIQKPFSLIQLRKEVDEMGPENPA